MVDLHRCSACISGNLATQNQVKTGLSIDIKLSDGPSIVIRFSADLGTSLNVCLGITYIGLPKQFEAPLPKWIPKSFGLLTQTFLQCARNSFASDDLAPKFIAL